jgi:hypothetical protein
MAQTVPDLSARLIGFWTPRSWRACSPARPNPSSLILLTILLEKFSLKQSWNSLQTFAKSTTSLSFLMRFMSGWFIPRTSTSGFVSDLILNFCLFTLKFLSLLASLPDMWERTITICSAGKTFSVTGWKLGWAYGPENLMKNLQTVHQNTVYTCPTPIQACSKKTKLNTK